MKESRALGRRRVWSVPRVAALTSADAAALPLPPQCDPGDELVVDFQESAVLEPYALAVIAAQAARVAKLGVKVTTRMEMTNPVNRFAISMGFRDFLEGFSRRPGEEERTVPLSTLPDYAAMHKFASSVASKVATGDSEVENATRYCLIELIRNVFDHSGAIPVVCAQRMRKHRGHRQSETVQVAVADAGVGLLATIGPMHEWVETDSMAIDAAMTPYLSRTYPKGQYAMMKDNAGLGLHFISELVKRSDGRMLLWSGSHLRLLVGDLDAEMGHHVYSNHTDCFVGTAAVFEFELGLIDDYDAFFSFLRDETTRLLNEDHGKRVLQREEEPPHGMPQVAVTFLEEDTAATRAYRVEYLIPRVRRLDGVCLDFRRYKYLSPSFAHALMYQTIRESAAAGCTLHIVNANEAVWTALEQVQLYALATPDSPA